jgi:hypothetical protein
MCDLAHSEQAVARHALRHLITSLPRWSWAFFVLPSRYTLQEALTERHPNPVGTHLIGKSGGFRRTKNDLMK